ncbi:LacI family DNA-binding transcriptional regulator [Paenarthrobacter sp. YJN-5]|uniref:LacI family DNA-binding transcriptional regulator n=1 Tax=Paenarthrobacter sp. YJN-5 TaxID=2735316 RepID=UPI001878A257|nr:LacI family DNA-binding transcriptional regulator [Paenarthrobacter sp. YJN-5]QOT15255.1 LacI family DNA-binding transcriptional regulator [Paenarthrobacter sp. YJN-5]
MTTMQDVARRAGVSAKTVSRVFNDEAYVSPETRARVELAMEQLGYVPNMLARTFREGRASVVGIAVPDIADPFFATIIKAIDRQAQTRGYTIAVTSLGFDETRERPVIEALLRRQVDGLVVAPISSDQSYLSPWQTQTPIVFIDREPANIEADIFLEDDRGGATTATNHLISREHRNIAFIGDSESVITTRRRLEGYKDALRAAGVPVRDDLVVLVDKDHASDRLLHLLEGPAAPTAVFSSNSRTSQALFPTVQKLEPGTVAFVSFGDFPMAAVLEPAISVINQEPARLGRASALRLFDRLDGAEHPSAARTIFGVELVERASSMFNARKPVTPRRPVR